MYTIYILPTRKAQDEATLEGADRATTIGEARDALRSSHSLVRALLLGGGPLGIAGQCAIVGVVANLHDGEHDLTTCVQK